MMDKTLEMYLALDRTHPRIVDDLLKEVGDELAGAVIAARKADVITDQKRIDLLVAALVKAEKARDEFRHALAVTEQALCKIQDMAYPRAVYLWHIEAISVARDVLYTAKQRCAMSSPVGFKSATDPNKNQLLYLAAERAAQWCERGDDHEEAAAVRRLIAEHAALIAGQPVQRKPIGYLFQTPIPPRNVEDFYEMRHGPVEYCPVENKRMLDEIPSVKMQAVYAD